MAARPVRLPFLAGAWARAFFGALLALCALLGAARAGGDPANGTDGVDEYALKAAFLSKFVKFVTWPGERGSDKTPLVLGVFGTDPFGKRLENTFEKRKEGERQVTIKRVAKLEEIPSLHLLFVPSKEHARAQEILRASRDAGLLVVGESPDFAALGATVNFYTEEDKLRFEINPEAAKRQKLKISSELLRLARIVKDKE